MVYDELRNSCGGAKKGGTKPLSRGRERRLASLVQKLEKNRSIDDYNAVIQEQWDKLGDFLIVIVPTEKAEKTKRGILAKIARIYNPLGVASLLTLCGKLLYRDARSLRISWDEQLPSDLAAKWAKWESKSLERITFIRALVQYQEPISSISLHVFGDASKVCEVTAAFTVMSLP